LAYSGHSQSAAVIFYSLLDILTVGSPTTRIKLWASIAVLRIRNPGSGAFLNPGSGMGKKSGSGSGMSHPDHISESLKNNF
jgi:hypothetical protein